MEASFDIVISLLKQKLIMGRFINKRDLLDMMGYEETCIQFLFDEDLLDTMKLQ